ncbi:MULTISPECIES: N-acetylglucosamine kinase [Streptomyces]|uniref:N-acetylglucosamine kinase n=1 Tax=Streptomyces TaxID=1883 RepID=UPI001B328BC1|nr:BadF/BadG/BcrA/BcrD ATPase family protein [Streptomyces sp. AgN23]QTI88061.1 ATPase [Streptomyces sp. AgN23]WTA80357.1 ATPase [Streptomyces antimycoticus]
MTAAVAVDLGKTGCRAVLWTAGTDPAQHVHEVAGAPGLADGGGVATARAAVCAAVLPLLERQRSLKPTTVCVGAAGAATDPQAARALAVHLLDDLPIHEVAVTSDAVTAHAGALGGRPGVVLAIGTGCVAVGIGADGSFARVDGWGPWLGDEGSGAWIGTAGLRAALRAHDGRGPDTVLLRAAVERFGDPDRLPSAIGRDGSPARTTASFAPDVARAADAGDAAAADILRQAAGHLATTVRAAAHRVGGRQHLDVTVTGGLTGLGEPLLEPLRSALADSPRPLHLRPPLGRPLEGARMLAVKPPASHEPHVVRVQRATPTVPTQPPAPAAAVQE